MDKKLEQMFQMIQEMHSKIMGEETSMSDEDISKLPPEEVENRMKKEVLGKEGSKNLE